MKRKNEIYKDIVDIKVINDIYNKRLRSSTKNKQKVESFENYYVSNITLIKKMLEEKTYIPGKYNIFIIKEPKMRLIMSQKMTDKLINHVVSEYFLNRIFDKTMIDQNVATRKNKGTHYGIKLTKKYLNEIKDKNFYILKFDIKKYFFNIDHDKIKELLRHKIKDEDALNLLSLIIDSTNSDYVNKEIKLKKEKEIEKINLKNSKDKKSLIEEVNKLPEYKKGKGLPIGNMTSQVIAVLYLNELDHYIKENLKVKYYIRYMDDGILLHEDKDYLKYCLKEIERIVNEYKLELNTRKTQIVNIKQGFDFLGFRYYIRNQKVIMKVKNQTKKRFKRKMKKLNKLVLEGTVKSNYLMQVKNSYLGHLAYGDTKRLRETAIAEGEKVFDLGQFVYISRETKEIVYL